MGDRRRVVRHVGDDRDVGRREIEPHGQIVDHFDRALARLAGGLVDQAGHAGGHGVVLHPGVAPARDVARHVLGGERVAVVPGHTGADVERILGRVVVHLPAFQKHPPERTVAVVFDEILQEAPRLVADLGPVVSARLLHGLYARLDAQRAALPRRFLRQRRLRGADQRVGRSRTHAQRSGPGQELAAVDPPVAMLLGIHFGSRVNSVRRLGCHLCLSLSRLGYDAVSCWRARAAAASALCAGISPH